MRSRVLLLLLTLTFVATVYAFTPEREAVTSDTDPDDEHYESYNDFL